MTDGSAVMDYRLYFLVSDLGQARGVVDALVPAGISWQQIHVVARQGLPLPGVPEAGLLQRTAVIEAARRGLKIGCVGGIALGLTALFELHLAWATGSAVILLAVILGTAAGAWISGMMGISRPHRDISQYQTRIDQGQLLIMADVPTGKVDGIKSLIKHHCPTTQIDRRQLARTGD